MTWVAELSALFQVILVDLVLAGDNAIVIAMAVASFPARQRAQLLMIGICAATVVRVLFAVATVHLMQIVGLMLAGGLLLLWVCWKLWREIESVRTMQLSPAGIYSSGAGHPPTKTVGRAITQIVVADVSMSLDNVLAVAGSRPRSHVGAGVRPDAIDCVHGLLRDRAGALAAALSLDRLRRPDHDSVCRRARWCGTVRWKWFAAPSSRSATPRKTPPLHFETASPPPCQSASKTEFRCPTPTRSRISRNRTRSSRSCVVRNRSRGVPEPWNGPGFWSITKYDDIHAISKLPQIFSSDARLGGITLPDPR